MIIRRGFGPLELVLILAVVMLIGGLGYYVYSSRHQPSSTVGTTVITPNPSVNSAADVEAVTKELDTDDTKDLDNDLKDLTTSLDSL